MSKDIRQIQTDVMEKIRGGRLNMRPRALFILGSVMGIIGLVAAVISSIFMFGVIGFTLRTHGPMGSYRLAQILSEFPWWALALAAIGITIGVVLLRRYDFSYKLNFKALVAVLIIAIAAAGWLMDLTGLNEVFMRPGPMQGLMRGQNIQNVSQHRPGWWRN
jgi:uncharacterized membrane protein